MEGVCFFSKCHSILCTTSPKLYGNLKIKKITFHNKSVGNSVRSFPNTVENKKQKTNWLQKDLPHNQQCCSHSHFLRGIITLISTIPIILSFRGTQLTLHTLHIQKGLGNQDIINSNVFLQLQLSFYMHQNANAVGLTLLITTV